VVDDHDSAPGPGIERAGVVRLDLVAAGTRDHFGLGLDGVVHRSSLSSKPG
jgi:hypothetical protein